MQRQFFSLVVLAVVLRKVAPCQDCCLPCSPYSGIAFVERLPCTGFWHSVGIVGDWQGQSCDFIAARSQVDRWGAMGSALNRFAALELLLIGETVRQLKAKSTTTALRHIQQGAIRRRLAQLRQCPRATLQVGQLQAIIRRLRFERSV